MGLEYVVEGLGYFVEVGVLCRGVEILCREVGLRCRVILLIYARLFKQKRCMNLTLIIS